MKVFKSLKLILLKLNPEFSVFLDLNSRLFFNLLFKTQKKKRFIKSWVPNLLINAEPRNIKGSLFSEWITIYLKNFQKIRKANCGKRVSTVIVFYKRALIFGNIYIEHIY